MNQTHLMPSASPLLLRALFVDFDGVLHATHGSAKNMREFVWMPILLEMLNGHPDVGIVVHASARRSSPAEFLRQRCRIPLNRWLGVTNPSLPRWPSILAWLKLHPEVNAHCILDDQPREFPSPAPEELIVCNGTTGLTEKAVQHRLMNWLRSTGPAPFNSPAS